MAQLLLLLILLAAIISPLESLRDSYGLNLNGVNLKFAVYNVSIYFILLSSQMYTTVVVFIIIYSSNSDLERNSIPYMFCFILLICLILVFYFGAV